MKVIQILFYLFFRQLSLFRRSLPEVKQFDTKTIWTKSTVEQKTWILGVLQEFKQSMLYMQPAFRMFAKQ